MQIAAIQALDVEHLARVAGGAGKPSCWNSFLNAWDFNPRLAPGIASACALGYFQPETRNTPEQTQATRDLWKQHQQVQDGK